MGKRFSGLNIDSIDIVTNGVDIASDLINTIVEPIQIKNDTAFSIASNARDEYHNDKISIWDTYSRYQFGNENSRDETATDAISFSLSKPPLSINISSNLASYNLKYPILDQYLPNKNEYPGVFDQTSFKERITSDEFWLTVAAIDLSESYTGITDFMFDSSRMNLRNDLSDEEINKLDHTIRDPWALNQEYVNKAIGIDTQEAINNIPNQESDLMYKNLPINYLRVSQEEYTTDFGMYLRYGYVPDKDRRRMYLAYIEDTHYDMFTANGWSKDLSDVDDYSIFFDNLYPGLFGPPSTEVFLLKESADEMRDSSLETADAEYRWYLFMLYSDAESRTMHLPYAGEQMSAWRALSGKSKAQTMVSSNVEPLLTTSVNPYLFDREALVEAIQANESEIIDINQEIANATTTLTQTTADVFQSRRKANMMLDIIDELYDTLKNGGKPDINAVKVFSQAFSVLRANDMLPENISLPDSSYSQLSSAEIAANEEAYYAYEDFARNLFPALYDMIPYLNNQLSNATSNRKATLLDYRELLNEKMMLLADRRNYNNVWQQLHGELDKNPPMSTTESITRSGSETGVSEQSDLSKIILDLEHTQDKDNTDSLVFRILKMPEISIPMIQDIVDNMTTSSLDAYRESVITNGSFQTSNFTQTVNFTSDMQAPDQIAQKLKQYAQNRKGGVYLL